MIVLGFDGGAPVVGRTIPVRVGGVEVLVETTPVAGTEQTSRIDSAVDQVDGAFARAQATIVEIATSTVDAVRTAAARAARPDQLEVEFGLKFSVKGDVIVAGASGEATLKVKLVYQRGLDEDAVAERDGKSRDS